MGVGVLVVGVVLEGRFGQRNLGLVKGRYLGMMNKG